MARESRRSGGRTARMAARAAALPDNVRPIRPGMTGGNYKPLTDEGMSRINEAVLDALETIGLADAPQSGIDAMVAVGAIYGDDGRIRFPRSLVEDMLALTKRDIVLHGRDPKYDLDLSGSRVHFGTAGAAVNIVDVEGNAYRDSTLKDLLHAAQLVDALDNIHFLQRPMVCRDIEDNYEMDINTLYGCCAGTKKHVGTSFSDPSHVEGCMEFLHTLAGGEDKWRERPFVSNSNCFVVPPMKFATESCETMEKCIRAGMPMLLLSAGQAGATAPAPLAATVVQAVAECLAGLVYVNAIQPGFPAVFGTWPFVADLRSGSMSGGSGEQALLTAACAQMHQYYGLCGGAAAGISDAKMPDMQAGWEQAISNTMAGLSGLNMVYESVGMHASLLGFCLESLVLGDDMLGQVMRCVRGVEVTEDNVSIETMKQVCLDGPGHYLAHTETLSKMQTEYVYPTIADRTSPKEWAEVGKPNLIEAATSKMNKILEEAKEKRLIDPITDAEIRKKFKIYV